MRTALQAATLLTLMSCAPAIGQSPLDFWNSTNRPTRIEELAGLFRYEQAQAPSSRFQASIDIPISTEQAVQISMGFASTADGTTLVQTSLGYALRLTEDTLLALQGTMTTTCARGRNCKTSDYVVQLMLQHQF
jgi:hypothetical protein